MDKWSVRLPSSTRTVSSETDQICFAPSAALGHIDVVKMIDLAGPSETFAAIIRQSIPPSEYTMLERFDLRIFAEPENFDSTLRILRGDARLGDIDECINFQHLPISMTDIINLYERQIARGHAKRLSIVAAYNTLPCAIFDIQRLAKIAAHSLTNLTFTNRPSNSSLSFADLPTMISAIRNDLPNLSTLYISMAGLDLAESLCEGELGRTSLHGGGKLSEFQIITSHPSTALFNTIRCILAICTPTVRLWIGAHAGYLLDHMARQDRIAKTDFLHYLRIQSLNRQLHLAKVDFSQLDVFSYSDVNDLEYDDDGRPRRLGETKSQKWHEAASDWRRNVTCANDNLEMITAGLGDFTEMSDQLQAMSGTATTENMLAEAERLRDVASVMVAGCATAAAEVVKLGKQARGVADELEKYVESLKGIIESKA